MPNTYFQFKQFIVHQDKCAMKVCTDSCLFGAWINSLIKNHHYKSALDIGTGTGLLSLMISQGNHLKIDAIEIDENAALQATENVSASSWKEHISILHQPLQSFIPKNKYDIIFSNPPFFENDLMSANEEKNAAKHHTTLTLEEIVHFTSRHLSSQGIAMVLLPFHRLGYFEEILSVNNLYVKEKILVKQTPKHAYFRVMICFSAIKTNRADSSEIIIRDEDNNYSNDFRMLLKEFYLS